MNDREHEIRLVSEGSSSDDASIARLLRLAGHRPEVPAFDAAKVKRAARAEWQRAVKADRRRSYLLRGGAGLLAAAALVLLVLNTGVLRPGLPGSRAMVATVERVNGPARAVAGVPVPGALVAQQTLQPGTVVETPGGARAALRLAGGASIRLDQDTRVRILSRHQLFLESGAVYADSGPDTGAGSGLEIHTALGVARDVGTQFQVRLDGEKPLAVLVREGRVVLDREAAEPHTVGAGSELAVNDDGAVEESPIPRFGPLWDWMLDVVPALEVRNPTIDDILRWAEDECGWQLIYVDRALEALAANEPLHGSVAGMTPVEAAEVAVVALGLGYRLEDGVFRVLPATP